jgi:hypothetical protein
MTTTITENCASIIIESEYLVSTNQSVTLNVTINCDKEYLVNIDSENEEITVSNLTLGLEDILLSDGVYYLLLTIIDEEGTTIQQSRCVFVNCDTCAMLETAKQAAKGDCDSMIAIMAYQALLNSQDCTSCACVDLCLLYKATNLIDCEYVKPCGCN